MVWYHTFNDVFWMGLAALVVGVIAKKKGVFHDVRFNCCWEGFSFQRIPIQMDPEPASGSGSGTSTRVQSPTSTPPMSRDITCDLDISPLNTPMQLRSNSSKTKL